jgi:hypothetical protein
MAKAVVRVPVSQAALLRRVNRKLAAEGKQLRRTRGTRAIVELGIWHVIDSERGLVAESSVEVESLARRIGVLREWELLVRETR